MIHRDKVGRAWLVAGFGISESTEPGSVWSSFRLDLWPLVHLGLEAVVGGCWHELECELVVDSVARRVLVGVLLRRVGGREGRDGRSPC